MIQQLPSLFSPEVVYRLDEETIRQIAGEKEASAAERSRLTNMLAIFEAGLGELRLRTGYQAGMHGKPLAMRQRPNGLVEINGGYDATRSETTMSVTEEIGVLEAEPVLETEPLLDAEPVLEVELIPEPVPEPELLPVEEEWPTRRAIIKKDKKKKKKSEFVIATR